MNIFECFCSDVFVETKEDVEFVKEKLGVDVKIGDIVKTNNLNNNYYIVKPLDTIETVAKKLSLDKQKLIQIVGGNQLFVGQKIKFK